LTMVWPTDVISFDGAYYLIKDSLLMTNEEIFGGDWARGPAGTGEVSWRILSFPGIERYTNKGLAESWEITGDGNNTLVVHVRPGVHWQNKAPTSGRELDSNDIVASVNHTWKNPQSIMGNAYPAPVSMTTPDKYTAILEYKSLADLSKALVQVCDMMEIWPADALAANNEDMRDWHNSIGTGPFVLTDYVKGASLTYVKNTNFWKTDPVGPGKGNKLPYVDGLKVLIVSDISTQASAIRTAKADYCQFNWEDASNIMKTNPELKSSKAFANNPYDIYLRLDNPSFPWTNKDVRIALMKAVDLKGITNSFYGGEANWYHYPFPAYDESKDFRVPFDQLPASTQDMFTYDLDAAKKLMSDAGYASGFDLQLICRTGFNDIDLLSIYKDAWSKLGVNVTLDPKENAVYNSIRNNRATVNAIYALTSMQVAFDMVEVNPNHSYNYAMINDPKCNQAFTDIWANYLDWNKRTQIYKDIGEYILSNAWVIPVPQPYDFTLWQPWLKNYHGEFSVGNTGRYNFSQYVWLDLAQKQKATGSQ